MVFLPVTVQVPFFWRTDRFDFHYKKTVPECNSVFVQLRPKKEGVCPTEFNRHNSILSVHLPFEKPGSSQLGRDSNLFEAQLRLDSALALKCLNRKFDLEKLAVAPDVYGREYSHASWGESTTKYLRDVESTHLINDF